MTEAAIAISTVILTMVIAAFSLAMIFGRPPKDDRLKHSDAAISFALDRLSWSDGRRFLRLYRSGAEDAIAVRFPKWREYRDWYEACENKLEIVKKDRTP